MVDFKILLRYRGNQQSANTITRQKTVFATSRLLKRKETINIKVDARSNVQRKELQIDLKTNLLGVIT